MLDLLRRVSCWTTVALGCLCLGCGNGAKTTAAATTPNVAADPWVLRSDTPMAAELMPVLWNGIVGFHVGADGFPADPAFGIWNYEKSGEERMLPLPPVANFKLLIGGQA